jgi:hypothetical protein
MYRDNKSGGTMNAEKIAAHLTQLLDAAGKKPLELIPWQTPGRQYVAMTLPRSDANRDRLEKIWLTLWTHTTGTQQAWSFYQLQVTPVPGRFDATVEIALTTC